MKPLDLNDQRHLNAAEGWLELGNHLEANEELENITAQSRAHPDVLRIRYEVYAKAKKWEHAAEIAKVLTTMLPDHPFGWLHWAYSLHELKLTKEARAVLLPVVDRFPDEFFMRYNLACYACQLGDLKEALGWLEKTIELRDKSEIKSMALNDPDLKPLWQNIGGI